MLLCATCFGPSLCGGAISRNSPRSTFSAFETAALDYRVADSMTTALTTGQSSGGLHPDELPISGVTWAIIAAALVARYVLADSRTACRVG